jgi:hypothetical protein
MPTCRKCGKSFSVFQWDLFGNCCAACGSVDPESFEGIFDQPCPQCGKTDLHATTAPALAYVMTKHGPQASKTAPGLYLIACSDCGHAFLKFNRKGARALSESPGWYTRDQIRQMPKS